MTLKKKRVMKVLRRSLLTGRAVWIGVERSYIAEYKAYKRVCRKESLRMNQWSRTMARRRNNILTLLGRLTERLPILGDIPPEQREAARVLAAMADNEPPKQSDFYDHICEERRQRENARKREKRWKEKYGNKNQ